TIDTNETYDNRYDSLAFEKYESLTFERKWGIFLWQMLYDENEMKALEDISLMGAINISHNLSFENIRIGDNISFNPRGTYTKSRRSSGRTLQDPVESWVFDMGSIQVNKITVPGLDFIIKDRTLSAGYSYRRDITTSALNPSAKPLRDSETHSGNMMMTYGIDGAGLNGNIGMTVSRSDTKDRNEESWNQLITPSMSLTYILRKEDPITVWDWVPVIGGKVFKFEQNLNLTWNNNMTFRRSKTYNTRIDQNVFTSSLSANYNMLQNLRASGSLSYSYTKDNVDNYNSYQLFTVMLGADLDF
ncbi:MAG TPA: hypothetical protein P5511_08935, partial [Candidatus Goldiibacteriota bacterium]|nr:hypothetical protein [Candidatus Goldiibacteriota bacterium]